MALEELLVLVVLGFIVYCWMRIVGKTGNSRWLGLVMLVPILNVAFIIWLAFSEWPIEQRRAGTDDAAAPDDTDQRSV